MQTNPDDLTVKDLLDLKTQQMLVINPEYQRGVVWTTSQKKKLVDSLLRGYPLPLIYLHHIRHAAGKLVSERYEVIDGQQRINALSDYHDGAYKLFHPVEDEEEARFPAFIKSQPCAWAGKWFQDLSQDLKTKFLECQLRIVKIETHDSNEARDLFVRLQAGMPLNSQEKRDAWPGQFTDFVLRLGGKTGVARYPGHDFFNILMRGKRVQDRGKFRQLAAQIAVLFLNRHTKNLNSFCDINGPAIDDFYYENLGFDSQSLEALRLFTVLDKVTELLGDQKRPRILGHEAIHLILLVDSLLDDYTRSWESKFAEAFDAFKESFAISKTTKDDREPSEFWLRYGIWTRVNSDRSDAISKRHEFFCTKMYEILQPQPKDPQRGFGQLGREIIYFRDKKRCAVCDAEVVWSDSEAHHIDEHAKGGRTVLENGVLVHKHCHPKGSQANEFAHQWHEKKKIAASPSKIDVAVLSDEDNDDLEESSEL